MDNLVQILIDGRMAADEVVYADSPQLKKLGVLGRKELKRNEGVLLVMKDRWGLSILHSIHMVGVPFSLAAAWIDSSGNIIHVQLAQPGKFYFPPGLLTNSAYILEMGIYHLELLNKAKKISWLFENGQEGP
jgi:uncharacterized membrane protein (UPF0127 family)